MQGLDFKSIKKHPSLIPLFFVVFTASSAVILFSTRTALKNPDVSWHHKKNPEPWQEYANKRYQLLDPAGKRGYKGGERPHSLWD